MSNKPRYERLKKKWEEQANKWTFDHLSEVYEAAWIELDRMIDSIYVSDKEVEKQTAYVNVLSKVLLDRSIKQIGTELEEPF